MNPLEQPSYQGVLYHTNVRYLKGVYESLGESGIAHKY